MGLRPILTMAFLLAWIPAALAAEVNLRIACPTTRVEGQALHWRVLVLARTTSMTPTLVTPRVTAEHARVLEVTPKSAEVSGARTAVFLVHLTAEGLPSPGKLQVEIPGASGSKASYALPAALDLSAVDWEAWWEGEGTSLATIATPPPASTPWKPARLPKEWPQLGVTWVRTRLTIPEAWRDSKLSLKLAAVDDRDATFWNGKRIGRTDGWDKPRVYPIPAESTRFGKDNELSIAVENVHAGGGIYRTPIQLCLGAEQPASSPDPLLAPPIGEEELKRPAPGRIGPRLPLRPMAVRDGILRYPDGAEVALWGVNYYPQSWSQYESLKRLGVDPRRSIDEDCDDFQRLGIEMIRIHVFDTEITDRAGNLVRNDHLDVLDYLVSQANARGIYLMLTPVAWWGSPSARPDSFSKNTPKQAMSLWPDAWPAQANYLRQFLSHKNPYTGRRLVDEPCLVLFEVINEPTYWSFEELTEGKPGWLDGADPKDVARAQEGVRAAWRAFIPFTDWRTAQAYACFRYDTLRRYIDTMIEAIRSTGARQPIAYFANPWDEVAEVFEAVGESRCDAITIGAYPGGLPQDARNDKQNFLGAIWNEAIDRRFRDKARLVYEFDAAGTRDRVSMYPAIARKWRELGVQTACQFQYDAKAVASLNWDWPQHYLNLWHTPEKMASFLIAGEVFRRLPRGAAFALPEDDQVFPPGAVSFHRNAALLSTEDCYMQARATDWRPLPVPERPRRVLAVGNCPYFDYDGTGIVDLRIGGTEAHLRIYPDADRLQDGLTGTQEQPLTQLVARQHQFRLHWKEWSDARLERRGAGAWIEVPGQADRFKVTPGEYRLVRRQRPGSPQPP